MLNYCCGGSSETISEKLSRYKGYFDKSKEDAYFFFIPDEKINLLQSSSLKSIFARKIEPELKNGAICLHIKHFTGSINIKDYEAIPEAERITDLNFLGNN